MIAASPVRASMMQTATIVRTLPGQLNLTGTPTPGSEIYDTFSCSVWETRQRQVAGNGKFFTLSRWKMRVPLDADIREHDVVLLGDTRLLVVTPPLERRGHQLVTLRE